MPFKVTNNATTTLASSVAISDTTFTVATGTGYLFPILDSTNNIDYFYVRFGTDETNEVKKCIARSSDTFTCNAFSSNWPSGTTVKLTVCSQLFDELPRAITTNTTYTVKSSGGTFNGLDTALETLVDVLIVPPAVVTIQLDPGEWNTLGPVGPDLYGSLLNPSRFLSSQQIKIQGVTPIELTMTSIESSSGSAGAWSYVLNLSSVSSAAVDHYILIVDPPTGGTNPEFLMGCHKITNVDSGNNRITINCKNKTATAASGATSGSLYLLQSVVYCDEFGFYSAPLLVSNSSRFNTISNLVLYLGGVVTNGTFLFSGMLGINGTFVVNNGVITSDLEDANLVVSGNLSYGFDLKNQSKLLVKRTIISGYTKGISTSVESIGAVDYGYIVGCTTGVYAESMSYVRIMSERLFGNTTNCDPVFDTQGNNYAFIESYSEE